MNNPTPQMRGPGPVGLAMAPVAKVDGIVTPPRRPARGTGQPPSPPPAEGSRWSARSALMLGLVGMLLSVYATSATVFTLRRESGALARLRTTELSGPGIGAAALHIGNAAAPVSPPRRRSRPSPPRRWWRRRARRLS